MVWKPGHGRFYGPPLPSKHHSGHLQDGRGTEERKLHRILEIQVPGYVRAGVRPITLLPQYHYTTASSPRTPPFTLNASTP